MASPTSEEHKTTSIGLTDFEGAKTIARRLFEIYDRDKDGQIDNVEVVPMIVDAYRSFNRNFSPSRGDIDSYTKILDRDRDGKISYSDIEDLAIKYLCPQGTGFIIYLFSLVANFYRLNLSPRFQMTRTETKEFV